MSVVGRFPNMMVVPNSSPWKSLKEFIAYAKANPGKINWASPGVGTSPHLAGELFKRMAGIEITHVPYRGVAAGAMSDLLAGRLDAMFDTTGSLLQAVRANQVRGLGVTSGERLRLRRRFRPSRNLGCLRLRCRILLRAVGAREDATRDRQK